MRRAAVIVDTHVVVAGLPTANDASPVARILDGKLAAVFPFVLSEALLAEYRTVPVRPKMRKLHPLTVAEVETILTDMAEPAIVLNPPLRVAPAAPDPGDPFLWWDLLAARADRLLVTGEGRLRQDSGMQGRVIAPQAFVAGMDLSGQAVILNA
jgi:predicted nucleic acid-binding protein